MITADTLQALGASWRNAAQYAAPLQMAANRFGIDTPVRIACWLGQLAHESERFGRVVENLNYSAKGLASTWPGRYAGSDGQPNATARRIARNPVEIANLTYAGRLGNGSAGTGDGWRYRGRGLIQITGRRNYERCGEALGIDLLTRETLLEQPLYAALSAGWFWQQASLNGLADHIDIARITRVINGGSVGLADRIELTHTALHAQGATT